MQAVSSMTWGTTAYGACTRAGPCADAPGEEAGSEKELDNFSTAISDSEDPIKTDSGPTCSAASERR